LNHQNTNQNGKVEKSAPSQSNKKQNNDESEISQTMRPEAKSKKVISQKEIRSILLVT
jgi:hypothetical protein